MKFVRPAKLNPGDKVAIVAPSSGVAALFPWVYELGLKRLKEIFKLEPIEFPTARKSSEYLEKNPQARAEDINAAFADRSIKAIIATIGGNDQIRILPYLNPTIIAANPKPFLGYSDCTHFHLYLWKLGMVSYYGASLMTQFAMQGAMHDFTIRSIKKALFEDSRGPIESSPEWTDVDLDWGEMENLTKRRPLYPSEEWEWHHQKEETIKGRLWGGCLEVLDLHLSLNRFLPSLEEFEEIVLYFETSEEMPTDGFVYRFVAALGELGILKKIKALLVGLPKSQFCGRAALGGRQSFRQAQKEAIKKGLSDYNAMIPVVFNLNFGHTDPQTIIPNGGYVSIDAEKKIISLNGE